MTAFLKRFLSLLAWTVAAVLVFGLVASVAISRAERNLRAQTRAAERARSMPAGAETRR
jgi:hypothetical protein